nr:monomeric sarcosine oxidase-like [Lytechinus pictus]
MAARVQYYDVCVVGAGPVGSAAARWLSTYQGITVCLIGPQEPTEEELKDPSRTIFGSHYDEARIVSEVCSCRRDDTWPVVTRRSIDRFRDIERESGINFYNEVGCVFKAPKEVTARVYESLPPGTQAISYSPGGIENAFQYLKSDGFHSIHESTKGGYVNPRKYITANKKIAKRNGCDIVDEVVCDVGERRQPGVGSFIHLTTKSRAVITSRKVLLCTGGFINFERLLPNSGLEIDIDPLTEMAVLIELTKEDAECLSKMPSILVHIPDAKDPRNSYILPPVIYPDGKYYLKVGHDYDLNRRIRSKEEVASWYRDQGQNRLGDFKSIYLRIYQSVSGFHPKSLKTMTCITTTTPSGQYYCDLITPAIGVAVGGNGGGVMVADEIGRIAARMILKGAWDSDLPQEEFRVRWRTREGATKSHL